MTRKTSEITRAKVAIAEIITYHKDKIKFIGGKPSPLNIAKLLKEKYKITVTRQFVDSVIKKGEYGKYVDTLCIEDNPRVIEIKDALLVQKSIWNDDSNASKDRTMASNSWRALQKQLIDYEDSLADLEIKKNEAARPIHLVKFTPPSVDVVCPKCGHNWFDIRSENDKKDTTKEIKRVDKEKEKRGDEWKPFYSKESKEQQTYDDFEDDKKEDFEDEFKKENKKTNFQVVVETTSK